MKILFFSHDAYLYGASRSMVNIIQGLKKHGVYCKVILPTGGQLETLLIDEDIEYSIIYFPRWVYPTKNLSNTNIASGLIAVLKAIKRSTLNFYKLINLVLSVRNTELIQGFDLIISNTSVIATGFFCAKRLGLPHVWFIRELADLHFGLKYILGDKFAAWVFKRSDLLVFSSFGVSNHFSRHYGIADARSVVIPNGVFFKNEFIEKKEQRSLMKRRSDQFVFCIVGHISKSKRQWDAIDAIETLRNEFSDIRLWVVGGGAVEDLRKYVSSKGLEAYITIFGFKEDVNPIYLEIDCLLVCSEYESFGRTTVEAMAYGIPVIGNDTTGTSEIIDHENTGLLYQGDIGGLSACMKRIITERDLAQRLGENGWRMAQERYTIENCTHKLLDRLAKYIKE